MTSLRLRWFVALIITFILTILPLPALLLSFRPPWILLFVLYVQFFLPDYFNLAVLLVIGLVLDVLLSTVLGEHAFALSFVVWVASNKARRFRLFSMSQQMVLIGFFCFLYQTIILIIDASFGYHVRFITSLGGTLVSILLWPWVRLILDDSFLAKISYRR